MMTNVIIDPCNIAEDLGLGPDDELSDLSAIKEPENKGMEFHVQMNGYTLQDMDNLIVEAAARIILGRQNDTKISKEIEAKAIAAISAKIDARLEKVTAEIIDQPVTPNWGDKKPVTMREMIGLYGKEYLTQRVFPSGEDYKSDGWGSSNSMSRAEHFVQKTLSRVFKDEITKATNAAITQIQTDFKAAHQTILDAEKTRVREALAKATGAA